MLYPSTYVDTYLACLFDMIRFQILIYHLCSSCLHTFLIKKIETNGVPSPAIRSLEGSTFPPRAQDRLGMVDVVQGGKVDASHF